MLGKLIKTNNPPPQAGRSTLVLRLPSEASEQINPNHRKKNIP